MRNRRYGFEIYLLNVKTIRTIAQIFVAFSEKLNFNEVCISLYFALDPKFLLIVEKQSKMIENNSYIQENM